MRCFAFTVWFWLLLASHAGVAAASTAGEFIPPGKEPVVVALVRAALASVGGTAPAWSARVERDVIRVSLSAGEAHAAEVVLGRPGSSLPSQGGTAVGDDVVLACAGACGRATVERWTPLAKALGEARDRVAPELWVVTGRENSGHGWPQWVSLVLAAAGFGWLLVDSLLRRRRDARAAAVDPRRRPGWQWVSLAVLLGAFAVMALAGTSAMPLHDHNSFVARSDCALDPACDVDPRGPAWAAPAFHVLGAVFRAFPYTVTLTVHVGLLLTVASLLLLDALIRAVGERFDAQRAAERVGLWTVALLVFHPVFARVAVGATFWPWALCTLLGAALAGARAASRGRHDAALACGSLLGLALSSNYVMLPVATAVLVAMVCWRGEPGAWRRALVVLAVAGTFAAPSVATAFETAVGRGGEGTLGGLATLPGRMLASFHSLFLDPSMTSLPVVACTVLGGVVALARFRMFAPALVALVSVHGFLSLWAEPLASTYPVGFIDHFYELYFVALLAAAGLEAVWSRAPARQRHRAAAGLAAACLAFLPTTRDALDLFHGTRVLERELAALDAAFDELPPHDTLVVPPVLQDQLPGSPRRSDPVEAFFPRGAYRAAMLRRGLAPANVVELDRWMASGPSADERTLVYVGTTLSTFLLSEIEASVVPPNLERPLLTQLRGRYALRPVVVFDVETAQHAAIAMRLAADRERAVEVGFYRPR